MCWRLRPYVFEAAATAVPSGAEPLPSGDIYIKRSAEMARKPAIGRAGRSTGDPYHIYFHGFSPSYIYLGGCAGDGEAASPAGARAAGAGNLVWVFAPSLVPHLRVMRVITR